MKNTEKAENWLYSCAYNGLAHSYNIEKEQWVKEYPEVTGYLLDYMCVNNYNEKNLKNMLTYVYKIYIISNC